MVETPSVAVAAGRNRNADLVLWGTVRDFSSTGNEANLDLELLLLAVDNGAILARKRFQVQGYDNFLSSVGRGIFPRKSGGVKSFFWRLFGWVVAVMLLPIVTYPVATRLVVSDSNVVVFLALSGYAGAGFGLGLLFMAPFIGGLAGGLLALFLLAFSLYYGWRVLDKIKVMKES
jgi:hypothetical protein